MPVNEEITREIPPRQFPFQVGQGSLWFLLGIFVDRQHACVHDATLVQRSIAHTTYSTGFQRRACQSGHEKPQQALNPHFLSNRTQGEIQPLLGLRRVSLAAVLLSRVFMVLRYRRGATGPRSFSGLVGNQANGPQTARPI